MDYSIIDNRTAATIKAILEFAKTFVFKDSDQADAYESTTSILWGSYFNSACDGTLPYLDTFGKKGFPNAQLNDYNKIPNGVEFFQQIYLQNSLYIGSSAKRLKEVREATPMENADMEDAPFVGNVFEANIYYRLLFCEKGVLPNIARLTPDHGLLYYDPEFYSKYLDNTKFVKLYSANRDLFTAAMENRAMRWDPKYHTFVNWMIVIMTLYSYLDSDLEKIYNIAYYDQYDIRNALYSYGITFLDELPEAYQLRVLKNIRELVRTKSTSETLRIVIQDIFGRQLVDAYKLYLVYGDPGLMSLGTDKDEEDRWGVGERELFFIKVPFDVTNPMEYIVSHPEVEKLNFENVTGDADPYWKDCPRSLVEEKLTAEFGDGFIIVPSKYIGISNDINIEEQNEGASLLFALLHYIQPSAVTIPSIPELHLGPTPLVYAMIAMYYLETAISCSNTGDMKPNWFTQPYLQNAIADVADPAWHVLALLINFDTATLPDEFKSVYFAVLKSSSFRTLWEDLRIAREYLNTVSSASSLAAMMNSLMKIYHELKRLPFFVSDAQDAVSGKLVGRYPNGDRNHYFYQDSIAVGLQLQVDPSKRSDRTITEKVFTDSKNNIPYPFVGAIWETGVFEDFSREAGFTEFTEYKILKQIFEKIYLDSNVLPSSIYFGAETAEDILSSRTPALFRVVKEAIEEGTGRARSVFSYLASEILVFLQNGGMAEGAISFDSFSKGYLAEFASMLVEKFVSYTVQLQVSGTKLSADGLSESYVGVFDHLSKTGQHLVLADSLYGLADRTEKVKAGAEGYIDTIEPESSQVNPSSLPDIMGGSVSADFIPAHDVIMTMHIYEQICYHADRYGIVANPFGIYQFDLSTQAGCQQFENRPGIWKWESFATHDQLLAHVKEAGSPTQLP